MPTQIHVLPDSLWLGNIPQGQSSVQFVVTMLANEKIDVSYTHLFLKPNTGDADILDGAFQIRTSGYPDANWPTTNDLQRLSSMTVWVDTECLEPRRYEATLVACLNDFRTEIPVGFFVKGKRYPPDQPRDNTDGWQIIGDILDWIASLIKWLRS